MVEETGRLSGMMTPCPVCGEPDGFHDSDDKTGKHAAHQVPRELLKESGWHKPKLINVTGQRQPSRETVSLWDETDAPYEELADVFLANAERGHET